MRGSSTAVRLRQLWGQAFSVFRKRDFRWYFGGMVATSTAYQVEDIARGWLVYSLTGSALALGWLRTGWSLANLSFALIGGIVADRVKKRTVLVVGHSLLGLTPLVIALLITTGTIGWWYLPISVLLESVVFSFIMPARQAFLSTLMGPRTLLNAMALSFFAMAIPGVVFATVGGALVDEIGAGKVFFFAALVYGLSVILFMQISLVGQISRVHLSLRGELLEGIHYMFRHPTVMTVLGLGIGRTLLLTSSQAFLPVFAADVFHTGAFGLGLLTASVAIGRAAGSLVVAFLQDNQHKGELLLGMGGASGVFIMLFAQSRSFYPALFLLFLSSTTNSAYAVVESTLLQVETAEEEMRGRMAGFLRLSSGLLPLAVLPGGFLIDLWGAPFIVTRAGLIAALLFLASFVCGLVCGI